jgi:hypothetical protein
MDSELPPQEPPIETDTFAAVDEMNLAELPLAAISDRFLDGTKTVVFEDTVWDRKLKKRLPRKLVLSGSDRYGLPTAKDDDVLLACVQVSHLGDFADRRVSFSRYELLKLLRWKDSTRNYQRLSVSLRRWKGLSIYSDRAFYDKERDSWVNKDFGVIDNLYIYEREIESGVQAPASSWFVWNEVLYGSFQAGYLKSLDWDLYCQLESAVAKRLYRFLDKRFYHSNCVEIELTELATRKIRISQDHNTGQMKRVLLAGIEELEAKWSLKRLPAEERFRKLSRGKWVVVFKRKLRRVKKSDKFVPVDMTGLETELTRRGIGPATAADLVSAGKPDDVRRMTELYDWYNTNGQTRHPGFLVQSIRNPSAIAMPAGFRTSNQVHAQKEAKLEKKKSAQLAARRREQVATDRHKAETLKFEAFWNSLSDEQQLQFEKLAVEGTDGLKRKNYYRTMGSDEQMFAQYRHIILCEHFKRTACRGI